MRREPTYKSQASENEIAPEGHFQEADGKRARQLFVSHS